MYTEKITLKPREKIHRWFKNSCVTSIRMDIRRQFSKKDYPKSPVWAFRGREWNSFHDPMPDEAIIINYSNKAIELKITEDSETIKKMVQIWIKSRKYQGDEKNF